MDFTLRRYKKLLIALKQANYEFVRFDDYCTNKKAEGRFVILRHDVDAAPERSLAVAKLEHDLGISSVYYFRAVPTSWNDSIISSISEMGHEVGYHYESLATCKGDMETAIVDFEKNLLALRKLVPVRTICMHGSPRSPYDSRDLWKSYDYHKLEITGEPYFDLDFSQIFYLTDTGRRWDGFKYSFRDKIPLFQDKWEKKGWVYHSTNDIIRSLKENQLSSMLMITTHPQRWSDNVWVWSREFCMQQFKNFFKRILIYYKSKKRRLFA